MSKCSLAWYRWWVYWNRKECLQIKEAIRKAFMQLWSRRIRQRLELNAKEDNQRFAKSWSELVREVDRDPVNVNRYVMDTLLALNYATALGIEPNELFPSRQEWLTRVVSILLSIPDTEAAPYVRYCLNPLRHHDLDSAILEKLWPGKCAEVAGVIERIAVALEPVLRFSQLGVQ